MMTLRRGQVVSVDNFEEGGPRIRCRILGVGNATVQVKWLTGGIAGARGNIDKIAFRGMNPRLLTNEEILE